MYIKMQISTSNSNKFAMPMQWKLDSNINLIGSVRVSRWRGILYEDLERITAGEIKEIETQI